MTQVDFYILKAGYPVNRNQFACRLIEKAYDQGHRVYLHLAGDSEVQHLAQLLWTFRDDSFVPHGVLGVADPSLTPILLGSGRDPIEESDVLITLAPEVPAFFNRFQRVAEIVDTHAERLRISREHFRFYRDRGYTPRTHELTP
jgi:DNA polymerase III subunit chi